MYISSKEAKCVSCSLSMQDGVLGETDIKYNVDFGFIIKENTSLLVLFKNFIMPDDNNELNLFLSAFNNELSVENFNISLVLNKIVNLILAGKDSSFDILGVENKRRIT